MLFSGISHVTTTNDVYNGYYVPKGFYFAGVLKVADNPKLLGVPIMANTWQAHATPIVKIPN